MDCITIKDLEVFYRVGVPDEERARPQRLLLTIELERDFSPAAKADALDKAIDYDAVSRRLAAHGEGKSWRLIETVAVELAELLLREFGAARATVEVKKFILPNTAHVSARARRPA